MRTTFVVYSLLAFATTSGWCPADEPIDGPLKLLINARVQESESIGGIGPLQAQLQPGPVFVATFLAWEESRQTWDVPADPQIIERRRGFVFGRERSRKVCVLQSDQVAMDMNSLTFSRLDGERVEPADVPKILEAKRAVAFLQKGSTIHPDIAAALHPETLVVTRRSYADDPILVPLPATR